MPKRLDMMQSADAAAGGPARNERDDGEQGSKQLKEEPETKREGAGASIDAPCAAVTQGTDAAGVLTTCDAEPEQLVSAVRPCDGQEKAATDLENFCLNARHWLLGLPPLSGEIGTIEERAWRMLQQSVDWLQKDPTADQGTIEARLAVLRHVVEPLADQIAQSQGVAGLRDGASAARGVCCPSCALSLSEQSAQRRRRQAASSSVAAVAATAPGPPPAASPKVTEAPRCRARKRSLERRLKTLREEAAAEEAILYEHRREHLRSNRRHRAMLHRGLMEAREIVGAARMSLKSAPDEAARRWAEAHLASSADLVTRLAGKVAQADAQADALRSQLEADVRARSGVG